MSLQPDPVGVWVQHVELLRGLQEALSVLQIAGAPVLVVKGMVLAYELYGDVADRPLADVDLRVRPRDFLCAVRALRAQGWRAQYVSKQLGAIAFITRNATIELESTVGPPGLCALSVAEMMARSVERSLPGGIVLREPEIVDHALLLVINAFKDKLVDCPPWSIADLEALARHDRFDAETFVARARAAGVATIVWIVADWLARDRNSEAWALIRDAIGSEPSRARYARTLMTGIRYQPRSTATRVLTRIGSDWPSMQLAALGATIVGSAVSRVATALDRSR